MPKESIACDYGMNFKIDAFKIVLPLTPQSVNHSLMSPTVQNPCDRCGSPVYPAEKMDLGRRLTYHKKCFRCKTCGLRLSLKTFYRESNDDKDIYCILHVPKQTKVNYGIDALGISSPMKMPKTGLVNNEVRNSPAKGWQFTPTKPELLGQPRPTMPKTPLKCFKNVDQSGILAAQLNLEEHHRAEEDALHKELDGSRAEELNCFQKSFNATDIKPPARKKSKRLLSNKDTIQENVVKCAAGETTYEEKRKSLLEKIEREETKRVAIMIEKHSREMLDLIAQTENSMDTTHPDVSVVPDVHPPQYSKYDLYFSETLFQDIDDLAEEIAKSEPTTFTELVHDLTSDCESELEKARAIFRWITCKDLNSMDFSENTDPSSPQGLLQGIKTRKESYHQLFKRLCSYVGLHCEIIQGHSKGVGYKPGQQLSKRFKNSWTAVNIEGHWRFVNCQWGSRHTKTSAYRDFDAQLSYKQDEFYFLTDPEEHIYQHFPIDPKWQLLERPITRETFIGLPVVKSPFFNNRFQFPERQKAVLYTAHGEASFKVRLPAYKNLCGRLRSFDGSIRNSALEGLVMIDIENYVATVRATPPAIGRYTLDLYVQDPSSPAALETACTFLIRCSSVKETPIYYPDAAYFGPTPLFSDMGLGLGRENPNATFVTDNGELRLRFEMKESLKMRETLSFYRPKKRNLVDLEKCTIPVEKRSLFVEYLIRCPSAGCFLFSLFAAPESADSKLDFSLTPGELRCVYRALITSKSTKQTHNSFPNLSQKWWSDAKLVSPLSGELDIRSHVNFKVDVASANDVCVVINKSWSHLERHDNFWSGTRYTGVQPGKVRLYAKFEEKGTYKPLVEYVLNKATAF